MVTDAEGPQSANGWCAPNDGDGKRVLARASLQDNDPHDLTASKGWLIFATGWSIVAHAERPKKIWLLATVMDGSALPAIDALPSRNAISEAPPRSGLSR